MSAFAIDPKACIRCAACATVAPRHFAVRQGPARATHPAQTPGEERACAAALLMCPTQAISKSAAHDAAEPLPPEPKELYPTVMDVAEHVRWKVSELPWASFDRAQATPQLIAVVREMAYSEQTTFSATQKFMEAFGKDADFSQWISVWFYEETRHPLVLIKWLALAGEIQNDEFVMKGRESEPFMPSLVGTLITNIISEMVASDAYLAMTGGKVEPLLHATVKRISADEARHGASFFTYAQRILDASSDPERAKLDALKVLHFWFNIGNNVSHPVNQAMARVNALLPALGAPPLVPPNERIAQVVGVLTGLPLNAVADLPAVLLEQTRKVRALTMAAAARAPAA